MTTQIILTTAVENLGQAGDAVNVKDGYARNFLIPRGLAMPATGGNLKRIESLKKKRDTEMAAQLDQAKGIAAILAKLSCKIYAEAGQDGKLFGSVTAANIAEALKKEGVEVDKKKVLLEHSIRELGEFDVEIKLHADVVTKIKVSVVSGENEPKAAKGSTTVSHKAKPAKAAKAEKAEKAEKAPKKK